MAFGQVDRIKADSSP